MGVNSLPLRLLPDSVATAIWTRAVLRELFRNGSIDRLAVSGSGVATGWTGVDISAPLLLEVAPEIDTNPTSFYRGRGRGVGMVGSASRPPL